MSHIICIASGKGGVGKTLVTAALSIALQRHHCSVLAVDADMGLRNLDLMFGVQDSVLYDSGDLLKGKCRPEDAVITLTEGLDFLAASQKRTWEKVDTQTFQYIVETLSSHYDYTIVDCPPGRGQAYKNSVAIADRIFFVVEPTWSSLRDVGRIMQFCDKHKQFNYDVLCNNFYRQNPACVTIDEMFSVLNPESISGILPHDSVIQHAANDGTLLQVDEDNVFFKALEQTVAHIRTGQEVDVDSLVQLLPQCEDVVASQLSADDEVPDAEEKLETTKLKKAVAVLSGSSKNNILSEPKETFADRAASKAKSAKASVNYGLSLRQRRKQSSAWRHYRR